MLAAVREFDGNGDGRVNLTEVQVRRAGGAVGWVVVWDACGGSGRRR